MNDCSNAEIRDRLPDLLHERLDLSSRAMIVSHVEGCVDCRDELELLRGVQKTLMAGAPRVDIQYVLGALPKPPARTIGIQPSRRRWTDWRIAAAVTLFVVGGGSAAIVNRITHAPGVDSLASAVVPRGGVPIPSEDAATAAQPSRMLASGGNQDASADVGPDSRFGGLSDGQLNDLVNEIERLQAVPVTEPEPVTITVDVKPTNPEGT